MGYHYFGIIKFKDGSISRSHPHKTERTAQRFINKMENLYPNDILKSWIETDL